MTKPKPKPYRYLLPPEMVRASPAERMDAIIKQVIAICDEYGAPIGVGWTPAARVEWLFWHDDGVEKDVAREIQRWEREKAGLAG